MTLQISFPEELENRLLREVQMGGYDNVSVAAGEALRRYFVAMEDKQAMLAEMQRRMSRITEGKASWVDGEAFFQKMEECNEKAHYESSRIKEIASSIV